MQFMTYSEGVELSAGHFQNADFLTAAQKESIKIQIQYAAQRYYYAGLCANAPCDRCSMPAKKIAFGEYRNMCTQKLLYKVAIKQYNKYKYHIIISG